MALPSTGEISMAQIYQEIYGAAPTGQVILADLVQASNLSDKTAPHDMNAFLGYAHTTTATAAYPTLVATEFEVEVTWGINLSTGNHDGLTVKYGIAIDGGTYTYETIAIAAGASSITLKKTYTRQSYDYKVDFVVTTNTGQNYTVGSPSSEYVTILSNVI
jgi:hypothetical protein